MEEKRISKNIKEMLKSRHIKIKDIAGALGIEPCHLSRKLTNNTIQLSEAVIIADYLHCSLDDLIGRTVKDELTERIEKNNYSELSRARAIQFIKAFYNAGMVSFVPIKRPIRTKNQTNLLFATDKATVEEAASGIRFEGIKKEEITYFTIEDGVIKELLSDLYDPGNKSPEKIFEKYESRNDIGSSEIIENGSRVSRSDPGYYSTPARDENGWYSL